MRKCFYSYFALKKWVFLCMLLFNLDLYADGFPQKISITLSNSTFRDVVKEIEKKTGMTFFYNAKVENLKYDKLSFNQASVEEVLNKCLSGSGLSYKVVDNTIVIVPSSTKQTQMINVQGRVVDEKGNPLPGVTIVIKGRNLGIATDKDGKFDIPIFGVGDVLSFSFVGMQSVDFEVKKVDEFIKIKMFEDVAEIEEVVVNGIFNRVKTAYTGSVTTITAKELKSFGNRSILTNIRNIDPSFNILTDNLNGADPNTMPQIQMRGTSSLPQNMEDVKNNVRSNLNQPLFIMDGFEIAIDKVLDMNPDRVESITLLKDASATALYGSRGANGIVVIVTKQPSVGKLQVTYRGGLNLEIPDLSDYNLLNAKDKLQLEKDAGVYTLNNDASFNAATQMELDKIYNSKLKEVQRGVDTYWLSKPLRVGVGQRHDITIDGGDRTFRYSANIALNDVKGVMKGSDRLSFDGSLILSYFSEKISFSNEISVGLNRSNNSPYGTFDQYVRLNPYYAPYNEDGTLKYYLENNSSPHYHIETNPLYNATLKSINKSEYTLIRNNMSFVWRIVDGLRFESRFGVNKNLNNSDRFLSSKNTLFEGTELERKGSYTYASGKDTGYDINITLNYNKLFNEKHGVSISANYNIAQNKGYGYTFVAEGFPNDEISFIGSALQYLENGKPTGFESNTRRLGFLFNSNYIYDERYAVDFSYRVDGSSQFGSDKRFAPFWSIGAAWNIHKEKFFDVKWISMAKIRYSYGITGSQQFSSYQAMRTYRYYSDDSYGPWIGTSLVSIGNDNLKWQNTKKSNIGFDLYLLNDRIALRGDFYSNKTDNLLSEFQLPLSNGFSSYTANSGIVKNTGFEIFALGRLLNKKDFLWTISGSIMRNKNKIVKISDALKTANALLEQTAGSNPNYMYREGEPIDAIYVVRSLGIDPSNGRELFLDRNGEKTYTWSALNKINAGVPEKYRGTISTMFRWRNWMTNISMGYELGGKLYNSTLIDKVENADVFHSNVDKRVYEGRWMKAGDVTQYKGINETTQTQMTSRFVQKNNYLDCYNINISYELNSEWLRRHLAMSRLLVTCDFGEPFRLSTIKQERGIYYPFSHKLSFSLSATF